MCLKGTPVALVTMFVGWFDTARALVTVDIAPTILAWARAARGTVLVRHVSPLLAGLTMIVLGCGQLDLTQGDVGEQSYGAALLPGLLSLPVLHMVAVAHPVVTHGHVRVTLHHLPLHEVGIHPDG